MQTVAIYLIAWAAIGGLVGAAIGSIRGHAGPGFVLGACLGPVGWIIAAVMAGKAKPSAPAAAIHPRAMIDPLAEFEMRQRVAQGPPPPPRQAADLADPS